MQAPWHNGGAIPATPAPVIDTSVPHPARRYNYWLGGKDNFAADRESADQLSVAYPGMRSTAIANRRFLERVVAFLAHEGVDQFLDVGTGIPISPNTHEIAQEIQPDARVVYVDNDPIVLSHARALLTSAPGGMTAYIDADMNDPAAILADEALRAVLDLSRPVAVMLISVLHFVPDAEAVIRPLLDAVPTGSWLVLSHGTYDLLPPEIAAAARAGNERSGVPSWVRSRDEITALAHGLDVVDPGVVAVADWRPIDDPADRPKPAEASILAVVARKP
jgi:hypothetical protein